MAVIFCSQAFASPHILNNNELVNGKHIASDFHIHAFNHNEGNSFSVQNDRIKNIFNDSSRKKYLRHITRRAREGGYKCTFHSFSEHVGYNSVNKSNMQRKINILKKDIFTSQNGIIKKKLAKSLIRRFPRGNRTEARKALFAKFDRNFWRFKANDFSEIENAQFYTTLSDSNKDKLKKAFAESRFIENECSFFSQGWEFTPRASNQATIGHSLVFFADHQSFISRRFSGRDFSHHSLYKEVLRASDDQIPSSYEANSLSDTLFAIAHPSLNLNRLSGLPSRLEGKTMESFETIEDFKAHILQKKFGLAVRTKLRHNNRDIHPTEANIKKRYIGMEFTRARTTQGDKRRQFPNQFFASENLYRSMLALRFRIMPMINGDRHSHRKFKTKTDPDTGRRVRVETDPNVNLTVLGPQVPLSDTRVRVLVKNINPDLSLPNAISESKTEPILDVIRDENLKPSFDGHSVLIVTGDDTKSNNALSEEVFYNAMLNRRGYISYKNNFEITTLANENNKLKHMGSKLDFNQSNSISININDSSDPRKIGDARVPNSCTSNDYKVFAVYANTSSPNQSQKITGPNGWIVEEEVPASSNCSSTYNYNLNPIAKLSPFIYFKVLAKKSAAITDRLIVDQNNPHLAKGVPIAITAAYINKNN